MEILYSGTDKILCDSLTLMLTESRIEYETNRRFYRVQTNDGDEVHQVLVQSNDWDSAARQLDMLTRRTQHKEAPASVNPGSRPQYAAVLMIALVISAGLAATKLLHSAPNPCLFLPQPHAPTR
ncbi:hypothetical protein CFBP6762_00557 [Xanthomonas arboricola pv. fragariae]|nr:hypothetical protein XarCFBP6762_16455 [Xanthomonas arboricola]SOT94113.1 hypothetical protein CFBP6762_00557 [Xanthomonas arboricola pv. fragariae]